jgi:hypothetical protein
MAVLQSMKKTHAMCKRLRVVFDQYLDVSLKNKTRQKRSVTSTEFEIHPAMTLAMSLKELLSSTKTKRSLTTMFALGLLEYYSDKSNFNMIVAFGNTIKGHDFEEEHSHEEADTLIANQVLAAISESTCSEVCVWSPDADVLTILLDLVSCGHLGATTRLKFMTGKGAKYREMDIVQRANAVGIHKSQGLIGLHNFSGADWGGKFVGITKKTWVAAYMKLSENDPIVSSFRLLGQGPIPAKLINGELPHELQDIEQFVCRVYSSSGPRTLPALRWELFRSNNLEGEMLPPTRAALLPHIARANFMAMRDKSYRLTCPNLPSVEQNGWSIEETTYVPVRCLTLPAPRAVIELTKCSCRTGCHGTRCTCYKNGLHCTPLCKYYSIDCENIEKNIPDNGEDDE